MKIAIFSSTIDVKDGYGNMTYEFCSQLLKKGIDFVLFLPRAAASDQKFPFPVEYLLPEYIFRIKTPKFMPYIFSGLDLKEFTLVHSLFDFPYAFYAARLAKRHKLPFIMGAQGTYGVLPLTYWPEKYLLKIAYRLAKVVIVPSKFTKDQILYYARENYNIEVIHNGVNFSRFNQEVDISDLKEKYKDQQIILTVGGLKNRKGQDLVIKALPKVKKFFPNIKYLIVGNGSWREHLENLVKENSLDKKVEFLGAVNNEELVRYFKLADVYVHTPRVINLNFEGFGIVYLEASACAKPIVATDAGGVRDAIVDGQTGFVVSDGDIEAIADKVIFLLSNDKISKEMGDAGLAYAKQHDWPIVTQKFIEQYQKYSL
jgi:phosphatidylinositol alpha-1,6-mannosyltransferase